MTKFIYFEDEIEQEPISELINSLQNLNDNVTDVELWFSTSGGSVIIMEYFTRVLNKLNEVKPIKIVFTFAVQSAGTELLTDYKGQIEFNNNLEYLMFHNSDRPVNLHSGDKKRTEALNNVIIEGNKNQLKKLKKLLTKKERSKIKSGDQVYLYKKDFDRVLKWREEYLTK